jgi:hypothetical protein
MKQDHIKINMHPYFSSSNNLIKDLYEMALIILNKRMVLLL